jgi:hypothetical protein
LGLQHFSAAAHVCPAARQQSGLAPRFGSVAATARVVIGTMGVRFSVPAWTPEMEAKLAFVRAACVHLRVRALLRALHADAPTRCVRSLCRW